MTTWIIQVILYMIAGAFTGLMSGALGIGGGMIVVPALLFIFTLHSAIPPHLSMHVAAASSLAIMVFTSLASIEAHRKIEAIRWDVFNRLWPALLIGTISGAMIAVILSTAKLKVIFGVFLLYVAYKMFRADTQIIRGHFPKPWLHHLMMLFTGMMSGLLGVGGGVLIIPYLTFCGISPRKIAPITSACTMVVACMGTITLMLANHPDTMPAYSTGFVYWPAVLSVACFSALFAPLGAKLDYILPLHMLRIIFIVILCLTALGLLI